MSNETIEEEIRKTLISLRSLIGSITKYYDIKIIEFNKKDGGNR